jgi:hypothetical protein
MVTVSYNLNNISGDNDITTPPPPPPVAIEPVGNLTLSAPGLHPLLKLNWPLEGIYIHTYHSRYIPGGVAEVSQIFPRDTHVLPKLVSYEEHSRRNRW